VCESRYILNKKLLLDTLKKSLKKSQKYLILLKLKKVLAILILK
jgi:hypothetical protein